MKIKTYKEPRWLEIRKTVLRRDKYIDQYLLRYGKYKNADLVHHILPVECFPQYQYCLWNLISLSKESHMKMHNRNNDKLTNIGKELLIRTCRKNNIEIPYWYLQEEKKKPNRKLYDI